MPSTRRGTHLVAVVLSLEVGGLVTLALLGGAPGFAMPHDHFTTWLSVTPMEEMAAVVLRGVALACAAWLLASTLLYAVARAIRVPWALRAVEWATLPIVRRGVDRALAVCIVASGALGPVGLRTATAAGAGVALPSEATTTVPPPIVRSPDPDAAPVVRDGRAATASVAPAPVVTHHVVAAGDNLWSIAAAHLASATARRPAALTNVEVARYWTIVVRTNRPTLRSGNPNLIHPGEVVELPPLPR